MATKVKLIADGVILSSPTLTGDATFDSNTLFVDSSANAVGIGTINGSGKLSIQDTTNINAGSNYANKIAPLVIGDVDSTGPCMLIDGNQIESVANPLYLNNNSSFDTLINVGGGNLGIGASSPDELLHVKGTNGAIAIDGNGSSNTASIKFINDNERSRITSAYDSGGGGRLTFHTDTTGGSLIERLRIDASGNVGIGTTSPDVQLEVAGASGNASSFKLSGRPDWTSGDGQYHIGSIYGENLGAGVNTTRIKLDGDDTSGSMRFYTANSGTLTSAMYIDSNQDITMSGSGSLTIPKGTTSQRNSSPTTGMIRYNTTESEYEVYKSSFWQKLDTTTYTYSADFLVVAGGGGGGNGQNAAVDAGGGGAGGLRTSYGSTSGGGASAESSLTLQQAIVYTITIGAGGSAQSNGQNSSLSGSNITTITSIGGGAGGGTNELSGQDGGSGGGSAEQGSVNGSGTSGQGYAGGSYGGGGAGEVGGTDGTGYGGDGIQVSITGSAVYYAGGGAGGGIGISSGSMPGGDGGGGDGRNEGESAAGYPGTANTGGGGGGANDDNNASGGTGGSGVVILRVPTASYSGTVTGSPTVTTTGSDTVIKFTSSGTYTG